MLVSLQDQILANFPRCSSLCQSSCYDVDAEQITQQATLLLILEYSQSCARMQFSNMRKQGKKQDFLTLF